MDHIEVHLQCLPGYSEILMAEMAEAGFDTFMDTDDGFKAYTEEKNFSEGDLKAVLKRYMAVAKVHYTVSRVPQKNWNEAWEKSYEPIIIGDECVVKASFHQIEQHFPYEIIINPKMSFGTGHHETTFLMLSQQLGLDHHQKKVLDVGCGTGILSIMALKLGAKSADGCDIDDWSVENSLENSALNDCSGKMRVALGTVRSVKLHPPYDIILANINRNVLRDEIPVYAHLLKEDGHLLVSGFYHDDIPAIRQVAEASGLVWSKETQKNRWACVLFYPEQKP